MQLKYNQSELSKAINDFYNATGISIVLVDVNNNPIASATVGTNFCKCLQNNPDVKKECAKSDNFLIKKCQKSKKLERHICHAGLLDTAVPIIRDDEIIGYIIVGQMRNDTDFNDIYPLVKKYGINSDILENEYNKLTYCDINKTQSIANIATILTEYILFKDLLKPNKDLLFENAVNYIEDNLKSEISTRELCDKLGISKNSLYKIFRNNANCTIGEFITKKRIDKAKKLLTNMNFSVQDVAEEVGISNYTYFSKLFKTNVGISPLKFKKEMSH